MNLIKISTDLELSVHEFPTGTHEEQKLRRHKIQIRFRISSHRTRHYCNNIMYRR